MSTQCKLSSSKRLFSLRSSIVKHDKYLSWRLMSTPVHLFSEYNLLEIFCLIRYICCPRSLTSSMTSFLNILNLVSLSAYFDTIISSGTCFDKAFILWFWFEFFYSSSIVLLTGMLNDLKLSEAIILALWISYYCAIAQTFLLFLFNLNK